MLVQEDTRQVGAMPARTQDGMNQTLGCIVPFEEVKPWRLWVLGGKRPLPNYLFCGGSCRLISKQALFFLLAAHLFSPNHSEGQFATRQRFLLQQQFCWLPL